MYGAILGDIIGSPYEWHNLKSKDFPLFGVHSGFTDDTVMTIAIAEALLTADDNDVIDDEEATKRIIVNCMHKWGHKYPYAGYGGRFRQWLELNECQPYNSWGNGSAMRVSAAGWLYNDIDAVRRVARWTAEITHDHPEGVKGAEAVASAILLARSGFAKKSIREYIEAEFGYDLDRTCNEIRPLYSFDVSCQGSVPEAIIAFLDSTDFEDTVRNAVSLGGDSDTIAAIAGSIAEAYYCIPYDLMDKCEEMLPADMREVLRHFSGDYQDEMHMNMSKTAENGASSSHRCFTKEDMIKEYKRSAICRIRMNNSSCADILMTGKWSCSDMVILQRKWKINGFGIWRGILCLRTAAGPVSVYTA